MKQQQQQKRQKDVCNSCKQDPCVCIGEKEKGAHKKHSKMQKSCESCK